MATNLFCRWSTGGIQGGCWERKEENQLLWSIPKATDTFFFFLQNPHFEVSGVEFHSYDKSFYDHLWHYWEEKGRVSSFISKSWGNKQERKREKLASSGETLSYAVIGLGFKDIRGNVWEVFRSPEIFIIKQSLLAREQTQPRHTVGAQ